MSDHFRKECRHGTIVAQCRCPLPHEPEIVPCPDYCPHAHVEPVEDHLVFSFEHQAWWRPNRVGYTTDVVQAGRYTKTEAEEISYRANRGSGREDEVAVSARIAYAVVAVERYRVKEEAVTSMNAAAVSVEES